MEEEAAALVKGMQLAAEAVGRKGHRPSASKGKRNMPSKPPPRPAKTPTSASICLAIIIRPANEYDLVYEVTGRLIPPQASRSRVGAIVNNIETFINIAHAAEGQPVTHKMLTIAGAVKSPVTLRVPIGHHYRDVLDAAAASRRTTRSSSSRPDDGPAQPTIWTRPSPRRPRA